MVVLRLRRSLRRLPSNTAFFWIRLGEDVPRAKEHYEGVMHDLGMYDKQPGRK